jgi:acyl carrier protein
MENQEILLQLDTIFSNIIRNKNMSLSLETTAADVNGWDSLTHMMIIDSIEKHFSIKFKLMEIMNFKNVGDMVACINKKLTK